MEINGHDETHGGEMDWERDTRDDPRFSCVSINGYLFEVFN